MRTPVLAAFILTASLLFMAGRAQAVWPFGDSKETEAAELETKANMQLQSADEAFRAGDKNRAYQFYQRSAEIYNNAEHVKTNFDNGLVRMRIAYCFQQIEQIKESANAKPSAVAPVAVTHPPEDDDIPPLLTPMPRVQEPISSQSTNRPSNPAPARNLDVRHELDVAQDLLLTNHLEGALASLIKVLKVDPENRRALLLIATVRMQQGRYGDAIVPIESLRGPDEDATVLMLAAGAYCGAHRYFDALLALDKVLKTNPDLPQPYLNMAYLLLEMSPEKRNDADMYYQQALKHGASRDMQLEKRLGR